MFTVCPSGRQWTLQRAKTAALVLDCAGTQADDPARQRQLQTLRQDLAMRGALPTDLVLFYKSDASSQDAVASCAEALGPSNSNVASVFLVPSSSLTRELLAAQTLTRVAAALANITRLDIGGCAGRLPDPFHLKKLTQLALSITVEDRGTVQGICESISSLLPQLQSLQIDGVYSEQNRISRRRRAVIPQYEAAWDAVDWAAVFSKASTTLTHFTAGCDLTDGLLAALGESAPALTHLTVRVLDLRTEAMMGQNWGVEMLCLIGVRPSILSLSTEPADVQTQLSGVLVAVQLSRLPKQREGVALTVEGGSMYVRPSLYFPYIQIDEVRFNKL